MKSTMLVTAFFLLTFNVFAQDWTYTKYKYNEIYPGYVVLQNGDTVKGYVQHSNRTYAQNNCIFYTDASKKEKTKYKPKDIKAYGVADKEYRAIEYSAGLMKQNTNFVLLAKPGRISQFIYYMEKDGLKMRGKDESDGDYEARIHEDEIVWQKLDEAPVTQKSFILGFPKKGSKLVSDYPELASKVEKKEKGYGLMNVFSIFDEYNSWWATKKN